MQARKYHNKPIDTERLPAKIQESLVTAIAFADDKKTCQLAKQIDVDLFDSPFDDIIARCLDYRQKYGEAPGKGHLDDVFSDIIEEDKNHKQHSLYNRIIDGMLRQADKLNTDYVFDEWAAFAQVRAMRNAISKAVERYQKGGEYVTEDVQEIFRAALKIKAGNDGLVTVRASKVVMKPVQWLWKGFVPFGRITVIGGSPKMGKSTVSLSLAATTSRGGEWPDGSRCAEPLDVLIFSAEDERSDTIVPRLHAMGADLDYIEIAKHVNRKGRKEGFSLERDLPYLERKLAANEDLGLVIIDPLVAFLGDKTDGFNEVKVRALLTPLTELVGKYGVAIICIMHFKKGREDTLMYQIGNSIAFTAQARANFVCLRDKDDKTHCVLLPLGGTSAKYDAGFRYAVENETFQSGEYWIDTARIVWKERIEKTADEYREQQEEEQKRESKVDVATAFLRGVLSEGPRPQDDIEKSAESLGIRPKTLRRASEALGVEAVKKGFAGGRWYWQMPTKKAVQSDD
jgi:putative DNA primase/helicase